MQKRQTLIRNERTGTEVKSNNAKKLCRIEDDFILMRHFRICIRFKMVEKVPGSGHETIPQPPDGQDMSGILPVVFDLAAETVDVDHNGIVIDRNGIAPDMLIDHIFGKYLLRMLQKQEKQRTFP